MFRVFCHLCFWRASCTTREDTCLSCTLDVRTHALLYTQFISAFCDTLGVLDLCNNSGPDLYHFCKHVSHFAHLITTCLSCTLDVMPLSRFEAGHNMTCKSVFRMPNQLARCPGLHVAMQLCIWSYTCCDTCTLCTCRWSTCTLCGMQLELAVMSHACCHVDTLACCHVDVMSLRVCVCV